MKRFQIFTPSDEYGNLNITDFEDSAKIANAVNGNLVVTDTKEQDSTLVSTVGASLTQESFLDEVKDKLSNGFDDVKNFFTNGVNTIESGVIDVYSDAKGGVTTVYSDAKGGISDVYTTGSNILESFEIGALVIGTFLAWGISQSFA